MLAKVARISLPVLWLIYSAILGALYVLMPPNSDQSLYDYIGWVISRGGVPYVNAADQNWPGIMFLHAAACKLFGNTLYSFRAFDYLLVLAGAVGVFLFTRRHFGLLAGFLAVPIYQILYVSQSRWFTGQRDIIAAPLMLLAAAALIRRFEKGGRVWLIVQGLAIALATLIRPTFVLLGPLLFVADIFLTRRTGRSKKTIAIDHLTALGAFFLAVAGFALAGLSNGALKQWYEIAIRFNVEVYGNDAQPIRDIIATNARYVVGSWHVYLLLGIVGMMLYWKQKAQVFVPLLFILLTTWVSLLVQRKGFSYHLGPFIIVLAVLLAPITARMVEALTKARTTRWSAALAVLGLIALVFVMARKTKANFEPQIACLTGTISIDQLRAGFEAGDGMNMNDALDLARHVEQSTLPDDTVLLWGRQTIVNYRARRRNPLRLTNFALLDQPREDFSLFKQWDDEITRVMHDSPPSLILIPGTGEGANNLLARQHKHCLGDAIFTALAQDYALERTVKSMRIYRRKGR